MLIGDEPELPYERPPLSKGYLSGVDEREKARVHDAQWYIDHDVELRHGVRATAVDTTAHVVTLGDGSTVRYHKLLLATGSRPRRLSAPGGDLAGVHYLRTLAHADALRQRPQSGCSPAAGWSSSALAGSDWRPRQRPAGTAAT